MDDYIEKARKYTADYFRKSFDSCIGDKSNEQCHEEIEKILRNSVEVMLDNLPVCVSMAPCNSLPPNCVAAIKIDEEGNYSFSVDRNKDTGEFQITFDLDVYHLSEENSEE